MYQPVLVELLMALSEVAQTFTVFCCASFSCVSPSYFVSGQYPPITVFMLITNVEVTVSVHQSLWRKHCWFSASNIIKTEYFRSVSLSVITAQVLLFFYHQHYQKFNIPSNLMKQTTCILQLYNSMISCSRHRPYGKGKLPASIHVLWRNLPLGLGKLWQQGLY